MSKFKDLVVNSLENYDINVQKYHKLISKIKYYKGISSEKDMEHNIIVFYDKDKHELFRSGYQILGQYHNYSNIWMWAWAMPTLTKNSTYLSKKILNYGLDIDPNDALLLKTELTTSRFKITNDIQLDIHIAISSYISKIPFIINIYSRPLTESTTSEDNTEIFYKFLNIDDFDEMESHDIYIRYVFFLLDYDKIDAHN